MNIVLPLRVLIVDDELLARERIRKLLQKMEGIEIVGMADNGTAAVVAIHNYDPDLVFLDIQMPGLTGFDVIKEIGPEDMPVTIFVTAYDQHALKAFDLAVVDYLLKPFDNERFLLAVQRARRIVELNQSGDMALRIRKALESVGIDISETEQAKSVPEYIERIAVESRGQVRVVPTSQIDYITASGVYAELHVSEKTYVIRESMQALEKRLNPRYFFRTNRSNIVQLDRIDVLIRQVGGDYTLKLKTGMELAVSRNRIGQLERWMGVLESHY